MLNFILALHLLVSVSFGQTITPPHPAPAPKKAPLPGLPQKFQSNTSQQPWLGGCGSCEGGPNGINLMDQFATFLGRSLDYVLVWGWAPDKGQMEYWAKNRIELWPSRYKILWSVPLIIKGMTFADCYNGKFDSTYTIVAKTIADRDANAVIRMGHEMNGNWYDWGIKGPAGSDKEFGKCFAHVATVMRKAAPGFKFVWNPGIGIWGGLDPLPAYPGDEFVDYVSLDLYEDSKYVKGTPDERWKHFLTTEGRGLDFWSGFAQGHHKPMAFDEWGSNYDDGVLITHMAEWMKGHNVHHQMYWNSEAAFSGSFEKHPNNGRIYKQLFGK